MPKRFTATEIWGEDWFLEMPVEYKLFWYYILSECDHAGLFKVNLRSFCGLNGVNIDSDNALILFNKGKLRIREINKSVWLIEDFFVFQYGTTLNLNNPMHRGIEKLYNKYDLKMTSIRGLLDHKESTKVKYKDKDNKIGGGEKKDNTLINNDSLCYDAEEFLLKDHIKFDKICIATLKGAEEVKKELHNYHLWLAKNEKYPTGKAAVIAGIESWIHNARNFKNKYNITEVVNGSNEIPHYMKKLNQ